DHDERSAGPLGPLGRRRDLFGLQRGARGPGRNGWPLTHRCNLNPVASIATLAKFRRGRRAHPPRPRIYHRMRRNGGLNLDMTRQATTRCMTTDALVPPKPNEFDSTVWTSRLRGVRGTRSIHVSTDGLSRLMVGGTMLSRIARMPKIASIAPAAPSRCPVDDLVDDIDTLDAAFPSNRSTAPSSISSPTCVEVPCALM